jgi:hypothetical protein
MNKEFESIDVNGSPVKLMVRSPQHDDYEESNRVYAAKVASLVREKGNKKLLLRQEVDKFLRDSGIWTNKDEQDIISLQKEVETFLTKLRKGGDKLSKGRELAIKIMDKRKEMVQILSKKQFLDDTTIEALAESEKNDYLIYKCCVFADTGKNYWETFEDMKSDKLSDVYYDASTAASSVFYNIDPEFEKSLPENKWLLKYNFIDEKLNYLDRKTGERVDRDGRPIKQLLEDAENKVRNLTGDIIEQEAYIDDETNEPVLIEQKTVES